MAKGNKGNRKETAGAFVSMNGNKKMSWPTFNLPARKTCPNSTAACRRSCYAMKAERMYPSVLPCRSRNLEATADLPAFVDDICGQLARCRKTREIFRIHESGDFYSAEYFDAWAEIARRNPETQFFAFTKVFDLFDRDRPANLTLIASLFHDDDRKAPKGAPVFRTVPRGETAPGTRCAGNCDTCGICPYAETGAEVWTEIH